MPKILPNYNQQRQAIGNHANWLERKYGDNQTLHSLVKKMAMQPGRHADNRNRQDTTHAALQLFSILSSVQNSTVTPSSPFRKEGDLTVKERIFPPDNMLQKIAKNNVSLSSVTNTIPTIGGGGNISNDTALIRLPRHAIIAPKNMKHPFPLRIRELSKILNFSCINDLRSLSFPQVLSFLQNLTFPQVVRHIGKTLRKPTEELTDLINKITGIEKSGCVLPNEFKEIKYIVEKIDEAISLLVVLIPGGKHFAIAQNIVGPLLELAANDLEGKETPPEEISSIIQKIMQQAKFSIMEVSRTEKMSLSMEPTAGKKIGLPIFHIKNGVNHIDVEIKGKVLSTPIKEHNRRFFALVPGVAEGDVQKYQVYFNHFANKWETTGNGKFNRFSKQERQVAQKFSIGTRYRCSSGITDKTKIYRANNKFSSYPKKLRVIEVYGHLVPYRHDSATGKSFIYDASKTHSDTYEVVLAENEWHLKAPLKKTIKVESLYCPEYDKNLNVAVVRKVKGREILAQINIDAGFFWGKKFYRNEENNLEILPVQKNKSLQRPKEERENEMIEETGCIRKKRGANLGKFCSPYDSSSNNIDFDDINTLNIIAKGSIGTVYDIGNGYIVKKYKGYFDKNNRSRIQSAKNNVKGFNRYYGPNSATIMITQHANEKSSVATKLIKIEGVPLSEVSVVSDKEILNAMSISIKKNPHETLSNYLRDKGIVHHDINKGNIIYNLDQGFSVIDFDSAHIYPEGEKTSQSHADMMKNKFLSVFKDTERDIRNRLRELDRLEK
ncbi:hypothetical protein JFY74_10730 [Pectobacterium carotovorum]|nr:hypothetical protein JFY74_10730 [Pectobacterium carotovorum]